jgi:hypothetical protein
LALLLRERARTAPARDFWTLTIDVVEGMKNSANAPAAETLRLLGAVERQIKTWIGEGEACFVRGDGKALAWRLREAATKRPETDQYAPAPGQVVEPGNTPSADEKPADAREQAEVTALGATIRNLAGHPAWSDNDVHPPVATDIVTEPDSSARAELDRAEKAEAADATTRPAADGDSNDASADAGPAAIASSEPKGPAPLKKRPGTLVDREPELRMSDRVPFSNTMPRLKWVERQSCQALARHAKFVMKGDGLVDRQLLKEMLEPLDCLIRNAVYYGIESSDARLEAGKSPVGRITLGIHQGGNGPYLTLETDGLAVDPERIRRKAEELGLLRQDQEPSRGELLALLAAADFSTAHVATQTAGYGVGLDRAKRQLETIGCSLYLSQSGQAGLRFRVMLPSVPKTVDSSAGSETAQ